MPCYHPLHAFKDKSKEADKVSITFSRNESWRGERLELPCGQCIGCRLERARQWAVRCVHEASLYEDNCFITLTYDDKFLPKNGSLCLKDFQNFMKRLRKKYGQGIRFFHCGEYGSLNGRPHYHSLLFKHDFSDKKLFSEREGIRLYTSDSLSKLWPLGFSTVGDVTFESASYVARYIMKKVTGKKAKDHYGERIPEYITMSRGSKKLGTGGIGRGWYEKYKDDVYPRDFVVVRGYKSRPPRFYDHLLGNQDRSTLALIKIRREANGQRFITDVRNDGKEIKINDSDDIRLMVREICKKAEIGSLKRTLEAEL